AVDEVQPRKRPPLFADVPRRLDPVVRDPSAAARSSRAFAEGVPDGRERSSLVRAGIGRRQGTMLAISTPLPDQGSIQFMILVVMLVIVAVVIWITIPR